MKTSLMRLFFKKELDELEEEYMDLLSKLKSENTKLQSESKRLKKTIEYYNVLLRLNPGNDIVGVEQDKNGRYVFVVRGISRNRKEYDYTLYDGIRYKGIIGGKPRLYAEFVDYDKENPYFKIHDIQNEDNNIGNGSILLKYLIADAEKLQVSSIKGWLSGVDSDHFDRSEHFYRKHGFEVKFDEARTTGSIYKKIKDENSVRS